MNSRTADKFVVRMPDGLRERIAKVAHSSHRSMNSEIIDRLERSLVEDGEPVVVDGLLVEHEESWQPALDMLVETPAMEPAIIRKIVMRDRQLFAILDVLRPEHSCEAILPLASLNPLRQRKRVLEG